MDRLFEYWPMLDEFEGAGYQRELVDVKIENGGTVEAYVYALNSLV